MCCSHDDSVLLQVCWASGYVELRVLGMENRNGELANGRCCGRERDVGWGQGCGAMECNTYFRACLKEYQVEVMTTGPCTFGTASSAVIGGNSFRLDGFGNYWNKGNNGGTLIIPFQFAWPVSLSVIHLSIHSLTTLFANLVSLSIYLFIYLSI